MTGAGGIRCAAAAGGAASASARAAARRPRFQLSSIPGFLLAPRTLPAPSGRRARAQLRGIAASALGDENRPPTASWLHVGAMNSEPKPRSIARQTAVAGRAQHQAVESQRTDRDLRPTARVEAEP